MVHGDHDAEKPTDLRHQRILPPFRPARLRSDVRVGRCTWPPTSRLLVGATSGEPLAGWPNGLRFSGEASISAVEQGRQFADDLGARATGQTRGEFRLSHAPIEALDLIRQDDPADRQTLRKGDLKRITLGTARNGTKETKANLSVIRTRRYDNRGTAPGLLMPCLRIQAYPDDIATFRDVGHRATRPLDRGPAQSRLPREDSFS